MTYIKQPALFCLLVILFLACSENDSPILDVQPHDWILDETFQMDGSLYLPLSMWKDKNNLLVIHDIRDQNYPLKVFSGNNLEYSIPQGRGPGEIDNIRRKHFSELSNARYIYDASTNRLLGFDEQYRHTGYVEHPVFDRPVYFAGLYSDSLLFTSTNDYIIQIEDIKSGNIR